MRCTGIVLSAALWLVASGARAQGIEWRVPDAPSAEDVALARGDYARGLEALEASDPTEALARFRASFARSGAAASLFNAAVALTRLERWVEARSALDVLAGLEPPETVRAPAAELSTDVDAHLARLTVLGVPARAAVVLDGRPIELDVGADRFEQPLDPGTHRLSVRAADAPPFTWSEALLPGERRVVTVELEGAATPVAGGGDDVLAIVLGVAAAVLVVGGAIVTGVVLDASAQLSADAPHVIRLP